MAFDWKKEYNRYRHYFLNFARLYNQREDVRVVLEIVLSLFTISFLVMFALRPTLSTIAILIGQIRSQSETDLKLSQKIKDLVSAQNQYFQEEEKINLLNQAIPDYPKPQDFVMAVEGLVTRHSLRLVSLSIEEVSLSGSSDTKTKTVSEAAEKEEETDSKDFFVSTVASGPYTSIISFWNDFENLRIPVVVDTTILSAVQESSDILITILSRVPFLGTNRQN